MYIRPSGSLDADLAVDQTKCSIVGGMGSTATVVYKRLASLLSEKRNTTYTVPPCTGSGVG